MWLLHERLFTHSHPLRRKLEAIEVSSNPRSLFMLLR